MGVRGKTIHAARKKADKMKAKASRRALYESYSKLNKNRKRDGEVSGITEHINCGNPACRKCYVDFHKRLDFKSRKSSAQTGA